MKLETFSNPVSFKQNVLDFLLQKEAQYCLGIGIIDTLIRTPNIYPEFHLAGLRNANNQIVGVSWITPPFPLGLTEFPDDGLNQILDFASRLSFNISAVIGPPTQVDHFQQHWIKRKNCKIAHRESQAIYELRNVVFPKNVKGNLRVATQSDLAIVNDWTYRFFVECKITQTQEEAMQNALRGIESKSRFIWEVDNHPVSMAGTTGDTPSGIRIGYVYTPQEQRGHGFASALVAKISQQQLDRGKKLCFLYTDLSNPTSNSIYQKIGYKRVNDSVKYDFSY